MFTYRRLIEDCVAQFDFSDGGDDIPSENFDWSQENIAELTGYENMGENQAENVGNPVHHIDLGSIGDSENGELDAIAEENTKDSYDDAVNAPSSADPSSPSPLMFRVNSDVTPPDEIKEHQDSTEANVTDDARIVNSSNSEDSLLLSSDGSPLRITATEEENK